jgi:hypothetical protein
MQFAVIYTSFAGMGYKALHGSSCNQILILELAVLMDSSMYITSSYSHFSHDRIKIWMLHALTCYKKFGVIYRKKSYYNFQLMAGRLAPASEVAGGHTFPF